MALLVAACEQQQPPAPAYVPHHAAPAKSAPKDNIKKDIGEIKATTEKLKQDLDKRALPPTGGEPR